MLNKSIRDNVFLIDSTGFVLKYWFSMPPVETKNDVNNTTENDENRNSKNHNIDAVDDANAAKAEIELSSISGKAAEVRNDHNPPLEIV